MSWSAWKLLDTGAEDATFDFNGDILLFVRRDGVLTKHRRDTWWQRYSAGDPCGGGAL
ncbi:SitI3 family protein [Paractinoplanes pyxinae]|uniref:SitI3 family protein n=1 Tax=Paractinoplanes pyxinae TaxID=2997416 RepID=UPI0034DAE96E